MPDKKSAAFTIPKGKRVAQKGLPPSDPGKNLVMYQICPDATLGMTVSVQHPLNISKCRNPACLLNPLARFEQTFKREDPRETYPAMSMGLNMSFLGESNLNATNLDRLTILGNVDVPSNVNITDNDCWAAARFNQGMINISREKFLIVSSVDIPEHM